MSKGLELVLTVLGYFAGAMFLLFLIAASGYGVLREFDRWKAEKMAQKRKRIGLKLGQPIEVEFALTPESARHAADIEVTRVFAYNGAVRVDVTQLLKVTAPKTLENIADQCRAAEGLAQNIPY